MRTDTLKKIVAMFALGIFLLSPNIFAGADDGKIPLSTNSDKALKSYLAGRDMAEKLRAKEARDLFEKAVAEDPNFAMAYTDLAQVQPTVNGFFENLDKAVSLEGRVSEGEKLWIQSVQAGSIADVVKQKECLQKLADIFPNDERVHNQFGNFYFGQLKYPQAIEEYNKAVLANPEFSQPYNQMGYSYRFLGNYPEAEKAFKKYIELIPNDPNPYDSYGELLLLMGRYDESIESYHKALAIDPDFGASYLGIASDLDLKGDHVGARKQLSNFYDLANDDGQRRAAYFGMAVSYTNEGRLDKALEMLQSQYALAAKHNDKPAMSGDAVAMGNLYLELGKNDEALKMFETSVALINESAVSQAVKDNAKLGFIYNSARVTLARNDVSKAKTLSYEYNKLTEATGNPLQIQLAHELAGMVAFKSRDYTRAIDELSQTNQQNAQNLFRLAEAYKGKGVPERAKEYYARATKVNGTADFNNALVRSKAEKMLTKI